MATSGATSSTTDSHGLDEYGYTPGLERSIGSFASFAAGVSYISILTGTFQLFYFGFGTAGPRYLWSWPVVFVGQLMVALCFAELSSRWSVAGSLYNWTKRLASPTVAVRSVRRYWLPADVCESHAQKSAPPAAPSWRT